MERSAKKRPPSDELIDLHVSVVPSEYWNQRLNHASQKVIEETFSAGFIRVHPEKSIASLRQVISDQIGDHLLSTKYVFLKHVGRCLAMVNEKQESQLKAKNFSPPQNVSPEIFILRTQPSSYNNPALPSSKLSPIDGNSQSKSGSRSNFSHEGENSSFSTRFSELRESGQGQRLRQTPTVKTNGTEHNWQSETPDRTLERFVSGKSAVRTSVAHRINDDPNTSEYVSSPQKHRHTENQRHSNFTSPQRFSNGEGLDGRSSHGDSSSSNKFDKSQSSKQSERRGPDFRPSPGEGSLNESPQQTGSIQATLRPNPSHIPDKIPTLQSYQSEYNDGSNITPYNDHPKNEDETYLKEKRQSYDHGQNNSQIKYDDDTNQLQKSINDTPQFSPLSSHGNKLGIGNDVSPLSFTEHTPHSDIQHVRYVKHNDSGFIENPNDSDEERIQETRRSKMSRLQEPYTTSQNRNHQPSQIDRGKSPNTRLEIPTKMSYLQTLEGKTPNNKENRDRSQTPAWGENTSEYSVRDSDTSSMLDYQAAGPTQVYSQGKMVDSETASNETQYHEDIRQKSQRNSVDNEEDYATSHKQTVPHQVQDTNTKNSKFNINDDSIMDELRGSGSNGSDDMLKPFVKKTEPRYNHSEQQNYEENGPENRVNPDLELTKNIDERVLSGRTDGMEFSQNNDRDLASNTSERVHRNEELHHSNEFDLKSRQSKASSRTLDEAKQSKYGNETTHRKSTNRSPNPGDFISTQTREINIQGLQEDANSHPNPELPSTKKAEDFLQLEKSDLNSTYSPKNISGKSVLSHRSFIKDTPIMSDTTTQEEYNKENVPQSNLPNRGHPDGMPVVFNMHTEGGARMEKDNIVINVEKTSQGRVSTPVPNPVYKKRTKGRQEIVSEDLEELSNEAFSETSARMTKSKLENTFVTHTEYDDNMETDMNEYQANDGRNSEENRNDPAHKQRLWNELQRMRERRLSLDKQRQDLVRKAKNTAQQINHRRGAGRDVWKRRYFNEKKKTATLSDLCERLNHQHDSFRTKWSSSNPPMPNPNANNNRNAFISRVDERPSIKSNSKIQATRTLMSIEDLKKRLNDAKLRLTGEVKMRHEAEQELKNMKQGLLSKKIQSHVAYRKMNRFRGYSNSQNIFFNQSSRNNNSGFHARLR